MFTGTRQVSPQKACQDELLAIETKPADYSHIPRNLSKWVDHDDKALHVCEAGLGDDLHACVSKHEYVAGCLNRT